MSEDVEELELRRQVAEALRKYEEERRFRGEERRLREEAERREEEAAKLANERGEFLLEVGAETRRRIPLREFLTRHVPPLRGHPDYTGTTSPSKSRRKEDPMHARRPKKVVFWTSFERSRDSFDPDDSGSEVFAPIFDPDLLPIGGEVEPRVQGGASTHLWLETYVYKNLRQAGLSDISLFGLNADARDKMFVQELKSHRYFITHHWDFNLVQKYQNEEEDRGEQDTDLSMGRAQSAVHQLYGYMVGSGFLFGCLSTYQTHWFFRRNHRSGILYISPPVQEPLKESGQPAIVFRSYAYVLNLASQTELTGGSPPQSPVADTGSSSGRGGQRGGGGGSGDRGPKRRKRGGGGSGSGGSNLPVDTQQYGWTDLNIWDLFDIFQRLPLGIGRSGEVVETVPLVTSPVSLGEHVALKIVDLSKHLDLEDELVHECEVYEQLADLQGDIIPRLVLHGEVWGGMWYLLATWPVGTALCQIPHSERTQYQDQAEQALQKLHDHRVVHGDLREENIIVWNGRVFLIDLAWAHRATKKEVEQERRSMKVVFSVQK